jgi:periplasmic copper chaperone A
MVAMKQRLCLMVSIVRGLVLLAMSAAAAAAEPVSIRDAWIRATPPGARTAAAYLTIVNSGPEDRLLGGATPAAERLEVHTHVTEGGMSRMVRLDALELPAGETQRLEPGGLHLMLIDVAAPLTPGMTVPVSLELASGGRLQIDVPVVDARSGAASGPRPH